MERASQDLKPSKCSISTWQGKGKGRWQSAGKGLKLHGRACGPGGTCFAQVFETFYMQNFDLARQGQRAKGAQEGFVS